LYSVELGSRLWSRDVFFSFTWSGVMMTSPTLSLQKGVVKQVNIHLVWEIDVNLR